ncbi:MAG: hypothetical protein KTR32_14250 [Granulosicoccus sp.]|nr:hypothetical protein [Granulosicoccus sp.]
MNLPRYKQDKNAFVTALFDWLEQRGRTRYDQAVTQLGHALQTANLAVSENARKHQITAALLHDIGHLIINEPNTKENCLQFNANHEITGSNWLIQQFGVAVSEPVRLHVKARRWLFTNDASYRENLSLASKRDLQLQGGKLTPEASKAFEQERYFKQAICLRLWDDRAKVAGKIVPGLETYREILINSLVVRPLNSLVALQVSR